MTELLFDDDDDEELPDPELKWSKKLVVAEPFADPADLNILEHQFRHEGLPAPVLFDDADGTWGPRDLFATAMGVPVDTLTLEAVEEWLVERYAGRV
jgi:hypothetical protein